MCFIFNNVLTLFKVYRGERRFLEAVSLMGNNFLGLAQTGKAFFKGVGPKGLA